MTERATTFEIDPAASAAARPTWVRWQILALLMAFSFMNHFNRRTMAVAGDERIMTDYGIEPTRMGWVYSAFLIAYTLAMLPGGWFIDRFGPRKALTAMGVGTGVFCALTGAAGLLGLSGLGVWICLLVVRALMGMCTAPLHPAAGKAVSHWFPPGSRVLSNGLVVGASCVGMALVFPVFGGLIDRLGWPTSFLIVGTITAGVGLVWAFYATDWPSQHAATNSAERALIGPGPPTREPHHPRASLLADIKVLSRNRSLMLLTIGYASVSYMEYLFFYWMHYYFEDILHLERQLSRYYDSFPLWAMAVGMPLGGLLADRLARVLGPRWGRAVVPALGMLIAAVCPLIGLLGRDPIWIVTWFSLALGALGATEGPFWTTAIELGGRRGATSGAICNTAGNGAGFVAPVLTPWVGIHFGWTAAIGLASVFCLVSLGLWGWIDASERVGEETEPELETPVG
jgi:MFS transporter, ACS family, D-galactonate transporter